MHNPCMGVTSSRRSVVLVVSVGVVAIHAACPGPAGPGGGGTRGGAVARYTEQSPPIGRLACDLDRAHPDANGSVGHLTSGAGDGTTGGGPAGCPPEICGVNASYLTGSVLDALNLDGCANIDGVRLVPGSLRVAATCQPTRFHTACGAIVGSNSPPGACAAIPPVAKRGCAGPVREGATFWIEGPRKALAFAFADRAIHTDHREDKQVTRIELEVRHVDVSDRRLGPSLTKYQIAPTGAARSWSGESWEPVLQPTPGRMAPMCELAREFLPPWEASLRGAEPPRKCPIDNSDHSVGPELTACRDEMFAQFRGDLADSENQLAIIAPGEVYYAHGGIRPTEHPARWFHLACAGGALAKARLRGYGPDAEGDYRTKRVAFHKMTMAYYCDHSETETGTPTFMYNSAADREDQKGDMGPVAASSIGPVEAYWNDDGATCIDHSRLWLKDGPPRWAQRRLTAWIEQRRRGGERVDVPESLAEEETLFVDMVRARCGRLPSCRKPASIGTPGPLGPLRRLNSTELGNNTVDHIDD